MSGQIQYGRVQLATSDETPSPAVADEQHFATAVRFGRRKSDPFGHLVLTNRFLHFRGAHDVNVAWSEIANVEQADREIIVSLRNTRRMLQFSCQTLDDAARGALVARELAAATAHRRTAAFA